MENVTDVQEQDINLVQPEQLTNQELVPLQEDMKDTDLVMIFHDQVLTTSLKVAEYFGKQHKNVIRAVEKAIEYLTAAGLSKNGSSENGFIETTYEDSKGENRRMYYLNRDAFTFMGFTGEKAAAWKWRYIQAFNRMEAELNRQQQNKPMTPLKILQHQVAVLTDHESRIASLETDIRQLRNAHNGVSLRHEIADIKVTISERSPRANIKALIEDTVRKYANTEHALDYEHAYACFYQEIRGTLGFDIVKEYEALQERRRKEGWSDTKISKISKIDVIEEHPELWSDIKTLISTIREDCGI